MTPIEIVETVERMQGFSCQARVFMRTPSHSLHDHLAWRAARKAAHEANRLTQAIDRPLWSHEESMIAERDKVRA